MNTLVKKELLHRKPWVVGILSFFTATLYSVYWFYKQFKTVGDKRPILKTILYFIFAFQLFPKLYGKATKTNKTKGIAFATLFLLITIASNVLAFTVNDRLLNIIIVLVTSALISLILAWMQKVVLNFTDEAANKSYSGPELAWIVVGICIFFIVTVTSFLFAPQNVIDARYAEIDKRISASETVERDLYQKNESCVSERNKELEVLDQTNQEVVDTYNKAVNYCDQLLEEYNNALRESLKISGEYFTAIFRKY